MSYNIPLLGLNLSSDSLPAPDLKNMEGDDISVPGSPDIGSGGVTTPTSTMDIQLASLKTYVDSLPYKCESLEEMQAKLESIVAKLLVCIKSKNWEILHKWDSSLQCWLFMRYPIPTATRAKLVRLYYELTVLPGLEPTVTRHWADMVVQLLANKPNVRRKLQPRDLQLPWQPLWRLLRKELWPKKRLQEPSRNVLNILLYVAQECKLYFPASEIPEILSTFLPLLTQETVLTLIPVLTSFLPTTDVHLYIPSLFKLWEAFNSNVTDERLIELCGELSEEHVAGKPIDPEDGYGAEWKDVGIWTESEWATLVGKALGSMNVPVGITRGASTTATQADLLGERSSLKIKKNGNRYNALAKIFVYSIAVDGPDREETATPSGSQQVGYLAGSKALDSLDKLITSTESFFHPSNSGSWSIILTTFIQRLGSEFSKRWQEEQEQTCKTPVTHRLTPALRKAFVNSLRTPALLSMFSKDPLSMSFAQGCLRSMALLEPDLIMPDLLERAYGGLEVVNETHRTTAVLTMLSGIVVPLVSEKRWLGGQKHILPLLELSLPGIDLNDFIKTICAAMFIAAVVQAGVKIGDLTHQVGISYESEGEGLISDTEMIGVPEGVEPGESALSRDDERALVRDSTAGFADWVVSLFRRVFALYENLPEEGGRRNTVPKQEETIIQSTKGTLDVVCLHLSDSLFDLVLKIVFEHATTNAKSNSVAAFGQLVASLARAHPEKTIDRFLPFCITQIQEELKHGASSIRTTSIHAPESSDTTLHWNMSVLRGCIGFDSPAILKHKTKLFGVMKLLVDETKSERGYSSTGKLLKKVTYALSMVYPLNNRFMNTEEWESPAFNYNHHIYWGNLYKAQDVKIEWHVPTPDDVDFILVILDDLVSPLLDRIDALLGTAGRWDNIARNDFCRYLHAVKSVWAGMPTFLRDRRQETGDSYYDETTDVQGLMDMDLAFNAGFALSDPEDPRYQKAFAHRQRFGNILHRAAITVALRNNSEGEDHIDAVLMISKGIDAFLMEYGVSKGDYDKQQKSYAQTRDLNRASQKQKENSRLVFLKRAQLYHANRLFMNSLYRRRSKLDDLLIGDLVELSLSPYTRVRRHSQSIVHSVIGYYFRSSRLILPVLFKALAAGTDPDRMKGALYLLWDKSMATLAFSDTHFRRQYLIALLECQHQEKPSIQKLVLNLAQDCLGKLTEEATHTHSYSDDTVRVTEALQDLETEFSGSITDEKLLSEALRKTELRFKTHREQNESLISSVLEITSRPTTHWRYTQMAARFLFDLIQRDIHPSTELARFFAESCISAHPNTRAIGIRGVIKMTAHIKARTYSKSPEELWLDGWTNPLEKPIPVANHQLIMQRLIDTSDEIYFDKIPTGFIVWTENLKGYTKVGEGASPFTWEIESEPALEALAGVLEGAEFFAKLFNLWGQESSRSDSALDLRNDNVQFIKSIAKTYEDRYLDVILLGLQPLVVDSDRYKQRAGAETLAGLLRGSKHWPKQKWDKLWSWTLERIDQIFAQIKPDTLPVWESVFVGQLDDHDPRRSAPLVQWILNLPLDFHGDSAFTMSKTITLFGVVLENLAPRSSVFADQTFNVLLDNSSTGYNEMRAHIASALSTIMSGQWRPTHASVSAFLDACIATSDPLQIRSARYTNKVTAVVEMLPKWKEERLPQPRTNQSQYDKVGLTLLQWIWAVSHGNNAPLMFRYVMPMLPEILRMSELQDSSELQTYATAVLYVLSAVTPPHEYVDDILKHFINAIKSSTSWRIRLNALPTVVVFFYRNLLTISNASVTQVMEVLLDCLGDENVEVREMASKALSGIVRCSQRQSIIPLKDRFVRGVRKIRLPGSQDPKYAEALRSLHSSILGLCALIESFPYSVESWMPPLTDILSTHATDPSPISTTIRKCASEFKKTHQDTWAKDQLLFDEDQLQNLSTMLVGTSYYA